jgi:hypothetical protein
MDKPVDLGRGDNRIAEDLVPGSDQLLGVDDQQASFLSEVRK